jgi:excinuclease ABC subunit B
MARAMGETERRRARQVAFNEANGITPRGVIKRIRDLIDGVVDPRSVDVASEPVAFAAKGERSAADVAKELARLEKAMLEHARNLEFEKAAQMRDQLARLKEEVFGVDKLHDSIEKAIV